MADDVGKSDGVDSIACADVANVDIVSSAEPQQDCPNENAWVLCDDCCKWRRIPVALANSIDENCRWYILSFLYCYLRYAVYVSYLFEPN